MYFINKKKLFTTLIIFNSLIAFGQEKWTLYPKKDSLNLDSITKSNEIDSVVKKMNLIHEKGNLVIHKDVKIDSLTNYIKKHTSFQGYTIQLVVSQVNSEIKENRKKFIENFSDEYLFDEYIAPNIYLYAGKFHSKNDAYHFREKISTIFKHTMIIPKEFPHNTKQKKGNQN